MVVAERSSAAANLETAVTQGIGVIVMRMLEKQGFGKQGLGKSWLAIVLVLGLLLVLGVARLSTLPMGLWLWELWAHFQVQYWGGLGVGLMGVLLLRWQRWVGNWVVWVALFCWMVQTPAIATLYGPPGDFSPSKVRPPLSRDVGVKAISFNVHPGNTSYGAVMDWVRRENPDLLLLMEVDQAWLGQLQGVEALLPYRVEDLKGTNWGNVLYSRYPLENVGYPSPKYAIAADIFLSKQGAAGAGRMMRVVAAHPLPPMSLKLDRLQRQVFGALIEEIKASAEPTLLMGDLNTTPWAPLYGRLVRMAGLRDGREGRGVLPSWRPAADDLPRMSSVGWWLQLPLDHALVTYQAKIRNFRLGPALNSDHLPIVVEFEV